MERLTMRDVGGRAFWVSHQSLGGGYRLVADTEDVRRLDRLAAYEDTGLEPEEVVQVKLALMGKALAGIKEFEGGPIDRMTELAQAEKDGRLVVLPCKVGNIVYRVIRTKDGHGHIAEATVSGLHIGDTERNRRYKKEKEYIVLKVDGNFCAHIDVKKIGETVFLTREEAEAALKKREVG